MSIRPCMGGWCQRRSSCPHHTDPSNRVDPAERICDPKNDGFVDGKPLRFLRETFRLPEPMPSSMVSNGPLQ